MQPGYYYVVFGFETIDDVNVGPFETAEEAEKMEDKLFPVMGAVTSMVCKCVLDPVLSDNIDALDREDEEIPY